MSNSEAGHEYKVGEVVLVATRHTNLGDEEWLFGEIRGFDAGGCAVIAPWDSERGIFSDLGFISSTRNLKPIMAEEKKLSEEIARYRKASEKN